MTKNRWQREHSWNWSCHLKISPEGEKKWLSQIVSKVDAPLTDSQWRSDWDQVFDRPVEVVHMTHLVQSMQPVWPHLSKDTGACHNWLLTTLRATTRPLIAAINALEGFLDAPSQNTQKIGAPRWHGRVKMNHNSDTPMWNDQLKELQQVPHYSPTWLLAATMAYLLLQNYCVRFVMMEWTQREIKQVVQCKGLNSLPATCITGQEIFGWVSDWESPIEKASQQHEQRGWKGWAVTSCIKSTINHLSRLKRKVSQVTDG